MSNKQYQTDFDRFVDTWWDENGPMQKLHQLNPVRLSFILKNLSTDSKDLSILDVGCGVGILTEPLARLGYKVTGIDLSLRAIEVAQERARDQNLKINYLVKELGQIEEKFDCVIASEIIEHVSNWKNFIKQSINCLQPRGVIFFSTINRTWQSYLKAIAIAEYLVRWVPVGTHDWNQFLKPSEIVNELINHNTALTELQGMLYNPIKQTWKLAQDLTVNYILAAKHI